MRFSLAVVSLVALYGCDGGVGIDETDGTDTDGTETDQTGDDSGDSASDSADTSDDCVAEIAEIEPFDSSVNVPLDTSVVVTFTEVVTEGDFTVTMDEVTGTAVLAEDGLSATFTPDAALATDTYYTARASVCDGAEVTAEFRTVPGPVDAEPLVGRTYAIDYDDVDWIEPDAITTFMGAGELPFDYILTQIVSVDVDTEVLALSGSLGTAIGAEPGIEQTECYDIIEYGTVDFSDNPQFEAGPSELTIPFSGYLIAIEDFYLSATVSQDSNKLENIEITGSLDLRSIEDLLSDYFSGDICGAAMLLGDQCEPCSDGVEKCLDVQIEADEADFVDGLDIDESYDPANDPSCL